jgi:hypothetical protein
MTERAERSQKERMLAGEHYNAADPAAEPI